MNMESKNNKKEVKENNQQIKLSKKQIETENKLLRNIFIFVGILFFLFLASYVVIGSIRNFNYRGTDFEVTKEGEDLIFYRTSFPFYSSEGEHTADYNFYIRNDPRKLEEIEFEGEIVWLENMVINMTEEFTCDGDGIIAIANILNLKIFGTEIIKDDSAGCSYTGDYMFLKIQTGNKTKIESFGPSCYNLYVNNCEILKVTEKFMVETFIQANSK